MRILETIGLGRRSLAVSEAADGGRHLSAGNIVVPETLTVSGIGQPWRIAFCHRFAIDLSDRSCESSTTPSGRKQPRKHCSEVPVL